MPRNLALIRRLHARKKKENQLPKRVAEIAGLESPADAKVARNTSQQQRQCFTESGDRQPCIMPACGHTISRIAALYLYEDAKTAQHQQAERRMQEAKRSANILEVHMLAFAMPFLASLMYIMGWPDVPLALVLLDLLLFGCVWKLAKERLWDLMFRRLDTRDEDLVPLCSIKCRACGTQQPRV